MGGLWRRLGRSRDFFIFFLFGLGWKKRKKTIDRRGVLTLFFLDGGTGIGNRRLLGNICGFFFALFLVLEEVVDVRLYFG